MGNFWKNKKWFRVTVYTFSVLFLIGLVSPKEEMSEAQNDVTTPGNKSVTQQQQNIIDTLGKYKILSESDKIGIIKQVLSNNNMDTSLTMDYYNCMGDFVYSKSIDLSFIDVMKWCQTEYKNNYQEFLSHINEFKVRSEKNYPVGFNREIEHLKNLKYSDAVKKAKAREKQIYQSRDTTLKPKQFNTIKELIADNGDYSLEGKTFEIYSKNRFRLSPTYVDGSLESVVLEDVKRAFIYGVYQTFIHTNLDEVEVTVSPLLVDYNPYKIKGYLEKFTMAGKITRSEALQVAHELLGVQNFDELVKITKIDNYQADSWSNAMNRARFNDQGYPTLNLFFDKLAKVSK